MGADIKQFFIPLEESPHSSDQDQAFFFCNRAVIGIIKAEKLEMKRRYQDAVPINRRDVPH